MRIRTALLGRPPKLEAALDRALAAAGRSGDARQLAAVVKAFGELWKLSKDASALALVEDVAKAGAIAAAKGEPAHVSPYDMVVEFVE